jgi:hypothetical protein
MQARKSSRKRVWTSLVWDPTRNPAILVPYKALSVAMASLYLQEEAVEEARWPLQMVKPGQLWERIPEEV